MKIAPDIVKTALCVFPKSAYLVLGGVLLLGTGYYRGRMKLAVTAGIGIWLLLGVALFVLSAHIPNTVFALCVVVHVISFVLLWGIVDA